MGVKYHVRKSHAHRLTASADAQLAAAAPPPDDRKPANNRNVAVRSAYAPGEQLDRLKQDIAGKGITFFAAIDRSALAAKAVGAFATLRAR
jgi:hypothetical protein